MAFPSMASVLFLLLLFLFSAYIVRISKGQFPGRRKQGEEIPITCGKVSMSYFLDHSFLPVQVVFLLRQYEVLRAREMRWGGGGICSFLSSV